MKIQENITFTITLNKDELLTICSILGMAKYLGIREDMLHRGWQNHMVDIDELCNNISNYIKNYSIPNSDNI